MAKNRQALGRGLSALIPEVDDDLTSQIKDVDVTKIKTNPFQPRKEFSVEKIKELAASIKESGLCQPIMVKQEKDYYILVNGERRLRAFKSLNKQLIPAIVRDVSDIEMRSLALIENIQRENLNAIEEAVGFKELLTTCKLSHEEVAEKVGKSRSAITNALRLLKLPKTIQEYVLTQKISMGHARALLALDSEDKMILVCQQIINNGISVREVEKQIKEGVKEDKKTSDKKPLNKTIEKIDPDLNKYIEDLQYSLGTQIKIINKKGKGKIEIEFYSEKDLTRICDLLLTKN